MKVKHTLQHSALAYQILWMIKSTMPFHWAFTTSPEGIPQPHIIPNDNNDIMDQVKWYTPAHTR
jgi:hypothetical protein